MSKRTAPAEQSAGGETVSEVAAATEQSRDIGPWKFSPWSGQDRWVHQQTKEETFIEKEARRRR